MHNHICTWLNQQMEERPDFFMSVLRTNWALNPMDMPNDIEFYTTSSSLGHADFLGIINGMLSSTGYRVAAIAINDHIQFVPEQIDYVRVENDSTDIDEQTS